MHDGMGQRARWHEQHMLAAMVACQMAGLYYSSSEGPCVEAVQISAGYRTLNDACALQQPF